MSDSAEQSNGKSRLPALQSVLAKLPWYDDLAPPHRGEMLEEVTLLMVAGTTRDIYAQSLERWAEVAHVDMKWARFALLRASGTLTE